MTNNLQTNVLIIDDNPIDCRSLKRHLRESGRSFHFSEANCFEVAAQEIVHHQFDCVFVDYHLPGLSGVDIIRNVINGITPPYAGIIVITGEGDEQIAAEAFKAGAHEYLPKTEMNSGRLCQAIDRAIEAVNLQKIEYHQHTAMVNFARTVAQEYLVPISSITGMMKMIQADWKDTMPDKVREKVDLVVQCAESLNDTTTGLFEFAQLDFTDLRIKEINLKEVSVLALDLLRLPIEREQAKISVHELPTVIGDRTMLVQLFYNILENALKFRSRRSPEIHISSERQRGRDIVSFSDNGLGIEEKDIQRIFSALERVDAEGTQGIGLGLTVCSRIMDMHGGQIWCEPNPDHGMTISIAFPDQV